VDVLYLNTCKSKTGDDIFKILESHFSVENIRVCMDMQSFSKQLFRLQRRDTVAVMLIFDEEDLLELYTIKHLLHRVITILILPDSETETVAIGYMCKPYFMTTIGKDLNEIENVIQTLKAKTIYKGVEQTNEEHRIAV